VDRVEISIANIVDFVRELSTRQKIATERNAIYVEIGTKLKSNVHNRRWL